MACIIKGKITKRRIMILSGAASGSVVALYLLSTITQNLAISTTMSALLSTAVSGYVCGNVWCVLPRKSSFRQELQKESNARKGCKNIRTSVPLFFNI
ncbi:MAG: hypothetical protein WBZ36_12245 [Candidatus Nitrosopolaris sp.]